MRPLMIFLIPFFTDACRTHGKNVQVLKTGTVVLTDSFFPGDHFSKMGEYEGSYPFYYIGPKHDSITIGEPYEKNDKRRVRQFKEPFTNTVPGNTMIKRSG